jgi:hypothetical protein
MGRRAMRSLLSFMANAAAVAGMRIPANFVRIPTSVVRMPTNVLRLPATTMKIPVGTNSYAGPQEEDTCYLIDTYEGMKYVSSTKPDELAWYLGLEENQLVKGAKPEDLNLIECAEDWSHRGTPQWVCKAERNDEGLPTVQPPPGGRVDMEAIGWEERTWAKATLDTTDDGACFIVSDEEAPDPSKEWFFCSEPSEDENMECTCATESRPLTQYSTAVAMRERRIRVALLRLVPEWMGQAPNGGHAVWMCSKERP